MTPEECTAPVTLYYKRSYSGWHSRFRFRTGRRDDDGVSAAEATMLSEGPGLKARRKREEKGTTIKITKVSTSVVSEPKAHPVRDAIQVLDRDGHCTVRIETDEGHTGIGDIYIGRIEYAPRMLSTLIEEVLGPTLIGEDPDLIRQIRASLLSLMDYIGNRGIATLAISAIDQALWDLRGKSVGLPVWRLLGATRTSIPTYATVGWLGLDIPGLVEVSKKAMDQGFRGIKMKVGGLELSEEIDRINAVRSVIGPDTPLMVDANQIFGLAEATRRGMVYQDLGCAWFEEPLPATHIDAYAELGGRLDIPIAAGESLYGAGELQALLTRGRVGVVQPDLRRAGGVTDCLEVGIMADGLNIPYASHGGGAHIHVLAALPNVIYIEGSLLKAESPVQLVDGCYPLPEGPGLSHW